MSLYNELAYTSYNVTGTYKFNNDQILYEVGTSNIILLNMIRYKIPIGKFSIFANTGLVNSLVIGVTDSRQVTYGFNGTVEEGKALDEIRKWSLGGAFGGGVSWKRISLGYRYQICNGISKYVSISSWTHRHIFLLGYKF